MADPFRVKTYANKADKAVNKIGHMNVSGTVEVFEKLVKGDKETKTIFDKAVAEALKS